MLYANSQQALHKKHIYVNRLESAILSMYLPMELNFEGLKIMKCNISMCI